MGLDVYNFMRERYNAHLVPLVTERAIPGFLFDVRWHWALPFDSKPEFLGEDGHAWDFIDVDESAFGSSVVKANIVQESVADQRTLGGTLSLPQYGLSFGSTLTSSFKISLTITGIRARVFDRSPAPIELLEALLALRESNSAYWDWINDDLLVTESYYVTSFHASFRNLSDVSAKAAFDAASQRIETGISYKWLTDSELKVDGMPSVPLAVRGLRV